MAELIDKYNKLISSLDVTGIQSEDMSELKELKSVSEIMLRSLQSIAGIEVWISDNKMKELFSSKVYSAIEKATK